MISVWLLELHIAIMRVVIPNFEFAQFHKVYKIQATGHGKNIFPKKNFTIPPTRENFLGETVYIYASLFFKENLHPVKKYILLHGHVFYLQTWEVHHKTPDLPNQISIPQSRHYPTLIFVCLPDFIKFYYSPFTKSFYEWNEWTEVRCILVGVKLLCKHPG